uniref:Uncharacterized protein n=1 Tax=Arundo donax TaxID=35708 RepID=A0A0A8YAK1_ARUDO
MATIRARLSTGHARVVEEEAEAVVGCR